MGLLDTFAESAEKDSIPYRACLVYLYVFSGAGAVYIVEYTGVDLPYHQFALGVVFLFGYLFATVAIAYVINAEYAHWETIDDA